METSGLHNATHPFDVYFNSLLDIDDTLLLFYYSLCFCKSTADFRHVYIYIYSRIVTQCDTYIDNMLK